MSCIVKGGDGKSVLAGRGYAAGGCTWRKWFGEQPRVDILIAQHYRSTVVLQAFATFSTDLPMLGICGYVLLAQLEIAHTLRTDAAKVSALGLA
jgi:hypothetical protein